MRVLVYQGTPALLRHVLIGHQVITAYERGWSALKNGELLAVAEAEGFDVFVTTDTNLRYQQNLAGRKLTIVVLLTTSWPRLQRVLGQIVAAVDEAVSSSYCEVNVPRSH